MTFELSDEVGRLDRDWIWRMLSTEAYWARWRQRSDVEATIDSAWRVIGAYDATTGAQLGYARAVSDGVSFAYLADVIVDPGSRGAGIGKAVVAAMIDRGPGRDFRWTLFTQDAHELYRRFGFTEPDATAMVRRSRLG